MQLAEGDAILARAGIGSYIWYFAEDRVLIDETLAALLGLDGGAQEIRATRILDRIDAADRLAIESEATRAVAERDGMKWSFRFKRDDGDVVWIATRAAPIYDADGRCRRIAGINFDTTDEMRRLIHSDDVAGEMGHRVKNILTVVTGMARLVDTKGRSGEEFKASILERLQGLSSAHEMIYRNAADDVTVPELARRVVWSVGGSNRLEISGPPTVVTEKAAQALTMALTELSTNALKHGALRGDVDGRVVLTFLADENENRFELIWRETSDREIKQPETSGYGSLVLDRVAASTFGGRPMFDWQATGLVYRCVWPLDQMVRARPAPDEAAERRSSSAE